MPELLSTQEVADMLGLHVMTVYRRAKELGGVKFASKRPIPIHYIMLNLTLPQKTLFINIKFWLAT